MKVTYSRTFDGPHHEESAENAKEIIHSAVKLLMAEAQITAVPAGIEVRVEFDHDYGPLHQILAGLGFNHVEEKENGKNPKPAKKHGMESRKCKGCDAPFFPLRDGQEYCCKDCKKRSTAPIEKTSDEVVPSGRYKFDGKDETCNASQLRERLANHEFGPGVRFFRIGSQSWFVVTYDEVTGYKLKPVED